MEKGVRKRGSFLLTTQGLEGLLPPVSESDGVSPDVVPVSEPDGELSLELLDGLLFDDSLELGLSLVVLGELLEGLG
jgi:hypothetical protein